MLRQNTSEPGPLQEAAARSAAAPASAAGGPAPGTPTPDDERQQSLPSQPAATLLALAADAQVRDFFCYHNYFPDIACRRVHFSKDHMDHCC